LSAEQKQQLTLRLYKKAGLLAAGSRHAEITTESKKAAISSSSSEPVVAEPAVIPVGSVSPEPSAHNVAPIAVVSSEVQPQDELIPMAPTESGEPPHASAVQVVPAEGVVSMVQGAVSSVDLKEHKRHWLELQLKHNVERIQRICEQYQVQNLDQLSETQFVHLANRIFVAQKRAQQKQGGTMSSTRLVAASVHTSIQH
jgi:hypothetical protein